MKKSRPKPPDPLTTSTDDRLASLRREADEIGPVVAQVADRLRMLEAQVAQVRAWLADPTALAAHGRELVLRMEAASRDLTSYQARHAAVLAEITRLEPPAP